MLDFLRLLPIVGANPWVFKTLLNQRQQGLIVFIERQERISTMLQKISNNLITSTNHRYRNSRIAFVSAIISCVIFLIVYVCTMFQL